MELNDKRWKPIKEVQSGGIIVLTDSTPDAAVEIVAPVAGEPWSFYSIV